MNEDGKYWGKYRGTVVNNVDPLKQGRVQVTVTDVLSYVPSTWAEPCLPLTGPPGPPMGFHVVPAFGTPVWIEFERGDPNRPVWVGCRWGPPTSLPLAAQIGNPADPSIVLQSLLQQAIVISDLPPAAPPPVMPPAPPTGGITLRSTTGAYIVVNDLGIFLSNGKGATVELVGASVLINKLAMVIT